MAKTEKVDTQLNKVRVSDLRATLEVAERVGRPVIILGGQGTGKSSVPAQFSRDREREMVVVRAAYGTPEDCNGFPVPSTVTIGEGDDKQTFRVSDSLMPVIAAKCWQVYWATGKAVTLFFDEMNQASTHMMSCLYEVFQDKQVAGQALPPGTFVIAAGNVAKDHGITNDIPFPLVTRSLMVEYLGPTKDEYVDYMRDNAFHPEVHAFLEMNPQWILESFNEDSPDGRNPTPRGWEAVSDILKDADANNVPHNVRRMLVSSTVGDAAALKLEVIMQLRDRMPTLAEIFAHPDKVKIDGDDLPVHYLLALQLVQAVTDLDTFDKATVFVERLRKEVIGVFLKGVMLDKTKSGFALKRFALLNKHRIMIKQGSNLAGRA